MALRPQRTPNTLYLERKGREERKGRLDNKELPG
jgi:hypothetical protein